MLKPTVKRGLILDFINPEFSIEFGVNSKRVFELNQNPIKSGDVIYFITREYRLDDNWGFLYAKNLAKTLGRNLKIMLHYDKKYFSKIQEPFFLKTIKNIPAEIKKDFEPIEGAGVVIVDFNPIKPVFQADCKVIEVDSHNIVPARFASDKQEYSAATLRRKTYQHIYEFLTEFPTGGAQSAPLFDFIEENLPLYAQFKNNPQVNATSNLSAHLHFGVISAQRVALEVIKSATDRENKEAFLEELVVRKELADNYCLYNKNYKSLKGLPAWALDTLNTHKSDFRNYIYTTKQFETAKTHDEYWNTIQKDLLQKNKIHGYLRMYWAKKILEWSKSPECAIKTAIYLNDKYSIDGNDPNGYAGILWSIGGLHDRAFPSRPVFGKIRYMNKKVKNYAKIDST